MPTSYDPDGFRRRHGIDGRFVLYAGRREGAKGWEGLVASFADAVARHNLPFTLVTTGTGPVLPPDSLVGRVVDLGFLPEDELANAYAAADAYLQPSALESFSRTIMESWLAGTPVIANADAAVVRWHCERSGAGLLYETPEELAACLDFVAQRPDEARQPRGRWSRLRARALRADRRARLGHLASATAPARLDAAVSRILMVTPYAPYRDGIAAYAVQQVKALRRERQRGRGALARAVRRPPVARPAQSAGAGGARPASEPLRSARDPVPPRRLLPRRCLGATTTR